MMMMMMMMVDSALRCNFFCLFFIARDFVRSCPTAEMVVAAAAVIATCMAGAIRLKQIKGQTIKNKQEDKERKKKMNKFCFTKYLRGISGYNTDNKKQPIFI